MRQLTAYPRPRALTTPLLRFLGLADWLYLFASEKTHMTQVFIDNRSRPPGVAQIGLPINAGYLYSLNHKMQLHKCDPV